MPYTSPFPFPPFPLPLSTSQARIASSTYIKLSRLPQLYLDS
ncbi:hypothetical protein RB213_012348 [Colletotrichum asianum]